MQTRCGNPNLHRSIRYALLLTLACIVIPLSMACGRTTYRSQKTRIKAFLQNAKVIKEKGTNKGVTHPWRLTLTDGTITHDASFQAIDEHTQPRSSIAASLEFGFVDSYKYNIAAYQLSELLGSGRHGAGVRGAQMAR